MIWRLRWQFLLAFLGAALLVALLGHLAQGMTTVIVPDSGGTYAEGVAGKPQVVNPLLARTAVDQDLISLVFEGLTSRSATGEVTPRLARSWTISPDGLSYDFELRQDVRWHDGMPFSAEDALFTFRLAGDPSFPGLASLTSLWRQVEVEKLASHRIRFRLPEAFTPFIDYTSLGLLPAHLLAEVPPASLETSPFNFHPIGTGPWRVESLTSAAARLVRNEAYYGRLPLLGELRFQFYPDPESVLAAYREGQVDGVAQVVPSMLDEVRRLGSLQLYNAWLSGYTLVFLNHQDPLFKDPRVRQALLWALDRQRLVDEALAGQGIVAHSPMLPGTWSHYPEVLRYRHDPARARELLEAAGWADEDGDGLRDRGGRPFQFVLLTNLDPQRGQVAEMLAAYWREVGLSVSVQRVDDGTLVLQHLQPRQFQAVLFAWQNLPADPDPYPMWHSTQVEEDGQNYGQVRDRRLDELIEAARQIHDRRERAVLYAEFQIRFSEVVPALLLYYPVYTYGVDERVREVQIGPLHSPSDRFRTLPDWYLKIKRVVTSGS